MSAVRGLRFVVGVKRFWWSFGALFARGEGGGGGGGGGLCCFGLSCVNLCVTLRWFFAAQTDQGTGGGEDGY